MEKQTTFVNCQRAAYSIQKSKHIWGFKVWLEWLRLKKNKHVFGLVLQGYNIKSGAVNKGDLLRKSDIKISHNIDRHK